MRKTTQRQRRHSHFQTGSAVYECIMCGKQTRDTGHGEDCCQMCRVCFDAGGQANYLSDNYDGERFFRIFGTDPNGYMEQPRCKTPEEVTERVTAAIEKLNRGQQIQEDE